MKQEPIIIFDTTLRDGEQAPGASMSLNDKMNIALALDAMGVNVIELGFAASSKAELDGMNELAKSIKSATVCGLARAKTSDIEDTAYALKPAKHFRIHTFLGTSELHLKHQLNLNQEDALEIIRKSVQKARDLTDDVEWSAMDATRTSIDFLARAVETAIKAGARTINIPDTMGITLPQEYAELILHLKNKVKHIETVILSVHCHNDLGLAVANSISALWAGARQIECTINGIGERAGNAALEEVISIIKTRSDKLPFSTSIDSSHFAKISALVAKASGFMVQKNKAIVGANAFVHQSGIHQDGFLKHRQTYEIINPKSVGYHDELLSLGKHSGRAALRYKLEMLQLKIAEHEFERLFFNFKKIAATQKEISDKEIIALMSALAHQPV